MNQTRRRALGLMAALPLATPSWSQAPYPSKPITLILPFPAGGQTDAVARFLAQAAGPLLGQPVVVDNRPGANTLIGTKAVAHAPADGYTLLLAMTALVTNPILLPNVDYDPFEAFTPVLRIYEVPSVWAVPPQGPTSLAEFIEKAKAAKKPLSFGTTGHASSSHYFGEILSRAGGFELNHIPYKGEAPLIPDLMGGRLDAAVVSSGTALAYGKDGRIRPLAVTGTHSPNQAGSRRWKVLPDLPTYEELGFKNLNPVSFVGIFVPSKTPKTLVERLNAVFAQIISSREFEERMLTVGLEVAPPTTPAQFAAILRQAHEEWSAVKKSHPINAE